MTRRITVALAGNPNCGKTTLFNALTGGRRHVGNWPGKTVERWDGTRCHGERELAIVDLPGAYSLTASSPEEGIARDVLVDDRPDVVVIVVDAAHLERNLFLATQILEFGVRAVVALNMVDVATDHGTDIDVEALRRHLEVPVIELVARRGRGVPELVDAIVQVGERAAT